MTDEYIMYLGRRYWDGERSRWLLGEMIQAMKAVEAGDADCAFGRELEAAIANLYKYVS